VAGRRAERPRHSGRALSPSGSDPTTAMTCIEGLGQTAIGCADRASGDVARLDEAGHPLVSGVS